ncbi:MAG: hypothetical protein KatS3mg102_1514 [Planctomycetota bacterium]|nr:MAG: hypothetical protein KatS3mg102_1514 [Planctomycetota bacterium]
MAAAGGQGALDLYADDPAFARRMQRLLGEDYAWAQLHLHRMGGLAAGPIAELAPLAEAHPPVLRQFDRDGERIDRVEFHPAYDEMRRLAYGAGLVALAYEDDARPGGGRAPHALIFGMGYLFAQAEQGLYCPICMTDGAARLLERFAPPWLARRFVPRLASRDLASLCEGAMWLTEKQGGSDVGANTTRAEPAADGSWRLHGEKWFCSNLGAEVMMVLARPAGAPAGTRGLGLYLVPLHREDGRRNAIRFHRLKDKLGTRSMATGEAALQGAFAWQLQGPGRGFKAMAEMLNLSRLYNAVASCACMRRAVRAAVVHARQREAFGRRLEEHPLHREVLAELIVESEAATALVFEAVRRLDLLDAGRATAEDATLWRALTPLVKLHTAKRAIALASEAIEALGGNGYIEEFGLARLLRDAQVLPIWEGTTNVLALDFLLRACGKEGALGPWLAWIEERLAEAALAGGELAAAAHTVGAAAAAWGEAVRAALDGPEPRTDQARRIAARAARLSEAALLLAEAAEDQRAGDGRGAVLALRHFARFFAPPSSSGLRAAPALEDAAWRALRDGTPLLLVPQGA